MFDFLTKSPLWQVLAISDWISKYIILLGLFILSIACTAIIIYKYLQFSHERRLTKRLLAQMKQAKTLSDLAVISKAFYGCAPGALLISSLQRLKTMIGTKNALSLSEYELLDASINQEVDSLLMEQEHYLPILGTSSAVSPLLGLFGTIWGLIHSFISISKEKSADIATVAPGIASALLTTLAGLIVAIPAMIAFNYFSNELRKKEAILMDVSESFMAIVKQSLSE